MSRRRNEGRPRGWRDQNHTKAVQPTREDAAVVTGAQMVAKSQRKDPDNISLEVPIAWGEEAIRRCPRSPEAHQALGEAYFAASRLEDAAREFGAMRRLAPHLTESYLYLAKCHLGLGRLEEAQRLFARASRVKPTTAAGRNAHTYFLLQSGRYGPGWREVPKRERKEEGMASVLRRYLGPREWQGEPLDGRLLIVGEDGFGDVFQFVRWVPLALTRAAAVTLLVNPVLVNVLRGQWERITVLGFDQADPAMDIQAWVPILTLPSLFQVEHPDDVPPAPYLTAHDRFRPLAGDFRCGIRWGGSSKAQMDALRSTRLVDWTPVFRVPKVSFYSLQLGKPAAELSRIDAPIEDLAPELTDWTQTAAVMRQLDLVISSDCSTAHLAGALGVPLWICLSAVPCWRWLLNRTDSPWYPSARLFRQRRVGEWPALFQEVAGALEQQVRERGRLSA